MKKVFKVDSVNIEQNTLVFVSDLEDPMEIVPQGQMLVDTDGNAFIYIIEVQGEYAYLHLGEPIWKKLQEGLKQEMTFALQCKDRSKIELPNFIEEMQFLIHNIKDNTNYGDIFVEKVVDHFYI